MQPSFGSGSIPGVAIGKANAPELSSAALAALTGRSGELLEALQAELLAALLDNAQKAAAVAAAVCVARIQEVQEEQRRRFAASPPEEGQSLRHTLSTPSDSPGSPAKPCLKGAVVYSPGSTSAAASASGPVGKPCLRAATMFTPGVAPSSGAVQRGISAPSVSQGSAASAATPQRNTSAPATVGEPTKLGLDINRIIQCSKLVRAAIEEHDEDDDGESQPLTRCSKSSMSLLSVRRVLDHAGIIQKTMAAETDSESEDEDKEPGLFDQRCWGHIVHPVAIQRKWETLPDYPRKLVVAGIGNLPHVTYEPEQCYFNVVSDSVPIDASAKLLDGIGPPPSIMFDAGSCHYRVVCDRICEAGASPWKKEPDEGYTPLLRSHSPDADGRSVIGKMNRCHSPSHSERITQKASKPRVSISIGEVVDRSHSPDVAAPFSSLLPSPLLSPMPQTQSLPQPLLEPEPPARKSAAVQPAEGSPTSAPGWVLSTPPAARHCNGSVAAAALQASSPAQIGSQSPRRPIGNGDVEDRAAELANQLRELAGHAAKLREASIISGGGSLEGQRANTNKTI